MVQCFLNAGTILARMASVGKRGDVKVLEESFRALKSVLRLAPDFARGWTTLAMAYVSTVVPIVGGAAGPRLCFELCSHKAHGRPAVAVWMLKRSLFLQFDLGVRGPHAGPCR